MRVPAKRGMSTRCEVRVPDPSCNPYLALAVMLASGLDGIEKNRHPGAPINKNIFTMSEREKRRLRIKQLPANLSEALDNLEKDRVLRDALGKHIYELPRGQAPGVARVHLPGPPLGAGTLPEHLLNGEDRERDGRRARREEGAARPASS